MLTVPLITLLEKVKSRSLSFTFIHENPSLRICSPVEFNLGFMTIAIVRYKPIYSNTLKDIFDV